jgi:hypothetical protein
VVLFPVANVALDTFSFWRSCDSAHLQRVGVPLDDQYALEEPELTGKAPASRSTLRLRAHNARVCCGSDPC